MRRSPLDALARRCACSPPERRGSFSRKRARTLSARTSAQRLCARQGRREHQVRGGGGRGREPARGARRGAGAAPSSARRARRRAAPRAARGGSACRRQQRRARRPPRAPRSAQETGDPAPLGAADARTRAASAPRALRRGARRRGAIAGGMRSSALRDPRRPSGGARLRAEEQREAQDGARGERAPMLLLERQRQHGRLKLRRGVVWLRGGADESRAARPRFPRRGGESALLAKEAPCLPREVSCRNSPEAGRSGGRARAPSGGRA